jgi:hypothetical protein
MAVPMNGLYRGGITPGDPFMQGGRIGFQRLEPRNRLQRRAGSSMPSIRDNLRFSSVRGTRGTQRPGELARLRATYAPESRAAFRAGPPRLLQSWMGRRVDLYA